MSPLTIPRSRATIALVAASSLVYEILLTRISALRLDFHFSYLVVANALLAVGVAGALLHMLRPSIERRCNTWTRCSIGAYVLSLPLTYAYLITYPVPYQVRLSTGENLGALLLYSAGASLPMLFAGAAIGLILMGRAAEVHRVYAADLAGAAFGCVACPLLLWTSGAGGALAGATALAAAALSTSLRGRAAVVLAAAALAVAAMLPFADAWFPVPSKATVLLAKNTSFQVEGRIRESRWSAISRVDLIDVPEEDRRLFQRSPVVVMPRPEAQAYLMQDGTAGTYVHDYSGTPEGLVGLSRSLYSLSARVLNPSSAFVIGVGGGDDVWAHHHAGTERIRGVELNRQVLDIHRTTLADYSRDLLDAPGIELVHGEGRAELIRTPERFDVVQMSGIDTWTALQSGAYMLAENFLYTQDAVADMFDVLGPHGALQVTRFSGEHEALRLLATIRAVHEADPTNGAFPDCTVCIPSRGLLTTLVKRTPFTEDEIARLDAFLNETRFEPAVHPRRDLGNALEAFVRVDNPAAFLAQADADLRPVRDDRPYFFNFTRWSDLGSARATIDAAVTVTQGNPLFLFGQLGAALLAGLIILSVPLLMRRGPRLDGPSARSAGVYFATVGAGFIAAEVGLMQKLVLLLGHPLYSVTVTLASMLLATGLGAYASRHRFDRPTRAIWFVPALLGLTLGALSLFDTQLVDAVAPMAAPVRFAVAALVVAPVGLAVGIPFAHGLTLLERSGSTLVPWAWATNAVATVVGSVATVIVSMNFGFRAVFLMAVLLYAVAAAVCPRLGSIRSSPTHAR